MTRDLLSYFNVSEYGQGFEGWFNWTNVSSGNLFIPLFLFVLYGISIHVASKSEYKLGGWVLFLSFVFFLLAMIAQTFTEFNQLVIFVFAIGMVVGVVLTIIENS